MLWDKLSNSSENDYIDFKREWYCGDPKEISFNIVKDIVCLSNSLSDNADRYIVIGVGEDKKTKEKMIYDVSTDKNHRSSDSLIQTLRNHMSIIPGIEVIREYVEEKAIDIIKITPKTRNLPYILNKPCEYEKCAGEKCKKHALRKDWVYSRDGDRNNGNEEWCSKSVLEELFARQRGEHLPILERFALYLDDIDNWKRPQRYDNEKISEDAYYYTKNHKFKIVRQGVDSDEKFIKIEKVKCYRHLCADTGLCEDYWRYRAVPSHSCYDDYYLWFNVELWADNTLIEVSSIMQIYLKYYFSDKHISYKSEFYLPVRQDMSQIYNLKTKEDIQNSLVWKICKLLYRYDLPSDIPFGDEGCSLILDYLNYDFMKDSMEYSKQNKDWIDTPPPPR